MTHALGRSLSILQWLCVASAIACGSSTDADDASASGNGQGDIAETASDVDEPGLCSLTLTCDDDLVDDPAVLCDLEVVDSDGEQVYADKAAVDIRGRSSQGFPKKNYAVELRTAADQDNPTDLLGMGKEADWVLDGAWADRSFMRNRLTYALFRNSGPGRWAPRTRYCELGLNGNAQGIYALVEKIKRDDDRVNLPSDDLSGETFLIKQDDDGSLQLDLGSGSAWQLIYPNRNRATEEQTERAQAWLDSLNDAMQAREPSVIAELFDLTALADWILVEEFSKNVDAYNLSIHVARAQGKAWIVPWDIDLGYGQPTVREAQNESPEGWIGNRTRLIRALSKVPALHELLRLRWRQLRTGLYSDAAITSRIDGYRAILNDAALERNFALWPIAEVDFAFVYDRYSFYKVSSYGEELKHLRGWIAERLAWMDENIESYPTE